MSGGGGGRGSGARSHHPGGGVAKERQKDKVKMRRKRSHYFCEGEKAELVNGYVTNLVFFRRLIIDLGV